MKWEYFIGIPSIPRPGKKKKKKKKPQKRNTGKRKLRIFWIYIGRVAICDAIHMCHV
jgi:hypothetical protein